MCLPPQSGDFKCWPRLQLFTQEQGWRSGPCAHKTGTSPTQPSLQHPSSSRPLDVAFFLPCDPLVPKRASSCSLRPFCRDPSPTQLSARGFGHHLLSLWVSAEVFFHQEALWPSPTREGVGPLSGVRTVPVFPLSTATGACFCHLLCASNALNPKGRLGALCVMSWVLSPVLSSGTWWMIAEWQVREGHMGQPARMCVPEVKSSWWQLSG